MPLPPRCSPSPPSRVVERQPVDVEPVACLGDLCRTVEGVAVKATEDGAVAIAAAGRAPASHLRLDDREMTSRVRVRATDEGAADRAEAAGRQAVAEVRREAAPKQVVQPDLDLVVRRERGRRIRIEHRSRACDERQRSEVPGVRSPVLVSDVHEDHLCRDHRAVAAGVVRPVVLVGVVAQVDDELVVVDLDRHV